MNKHIYDYNELMAKAGRYRVSKLEKAYVNVNPNEEPRWAKDENLITWLKKF